MANRYWVGGTGTWDTSSTTNWSAATAISLATTSCTGTTLTTTGSPALVVGMTVWSSTYVSLGTIVSGSGNTWTVSIGGTYIAQSMTAATVGASVPTAADAVFFDQATTYTVTMTGALTCLDFTISAGTVTFATGTSPTLAISGSMSLRTGTVWSATGAITFNSASSGNTVTTNGTTINASVSFSNASGDWTLGSALTLGGGSSALAIVAGSLDTSVSNYAMSAASLSYSGAATARLILNASTVTLSGTTPVNFAVGAFALNAGTSTITCSASNVFTFNGGGQTFYNVSFTSTAGAGVSTSINNANTFNNLSIASPAAAGVRVVNFSANQTINGTFTGSGSAITQRIAYFSATIGTPVTLTLANATALSNCDFRDITAAGNAITATTSGDCGGNTNISGFAAGKTVYWNLAGTQNWSATAWSTSTDGGATLSAAALANFPLAQDTAVFNNTNAATTTVTFNANWNIGTLNMAPRTSGLVLTMTASNSPNIYGSFSNAANIVHSGTSALVFAGRSGTQQITSNGKSFTEAITINTAGATVQLQDALTTSAATTLTWGTLDLNGKALTSLSFSSSNSNTRTLAFGAGSITVTGTGTVWTTSVMTNLSVTGTPVVNVTNASATATTVTTGALSEANSVSFNFTAGTYALTFLNAANSAARSVNFTNTFGGTWNAFSATATIYGDLTLSGTNTALLPVTANTLTLASTSATARTITTSGKTIDFPLTFNGLGGTFQFADALTMGSGRAFTITNGTVKLLAGSTNSVGSFATGAGTTQRYLQTTSAGNSATLNSASSGSITYLTIQDINATGSASWNAPLSSGNINAGGNTGWVFGGNMSSGLSRGVGLYIGSSGLYKGSAGLFSGTSGLKD